MIYSNVLDCVGNTPIIKLNRLAPKDGADIYVKFEAVNVGGSIKTRTAYRMIKDAIEKGLIKKDTTIVEATSGNQGIGISLCAAVLGYKALIIMPDSVSEERRKIVKQYGARVELVHDAGDIGECIKKCKAKAIEYSKKDGYFMPAQFDNPANVLAQNETGNEIIKDLKKVDGFCSGIGTGGTITGIGKVLKDNNPDITIWALEPTRAAILSHGEIKDHIQMGIGDGIIPNILDQSIYDEVVLISDEEAVKTAKELASKEGLLCGITGGTNVCGAIKLAKKLGKGKVVVTILPDTAERYFTTPLFD